MACSLDELVNEFNHEFDKWINVKIVERQVKPTNFCSVFVPVRKDDRVTRSCLYTRNVNCMLGDETANSIHQWT